MATAARFPWDRLYSTAERIGAVDLWECLDDGEVFGFTVPGQREPWYLTVAPRSDEGPVLILYPGDAAARVLILPSDSEYVPHAVLDLPQFQIEWEALLEVLPGEKAWLVGQGLWHPGASRRQTVVRRGEPWRVPWLLDDAQEAERLIAPCERACQLLEWMYEDGSIPEIEGEWTVAVATGFDAVGAPQWELRDLDPTVAPPVPVADFAAITAVQGLPRNPQTLGLALLRLDEPVAIERTRGALRLGYDGLLLGAHVDDGSLCPPVYLDDPHDTPLEGQVSRKLCKLLSSLGYLPARFEIEPESLRCLLEPTLNALGIVGERASEILPEDFAGPASSVSYSAYDLWFDYDRESREEAAFEERFSYVEDMSMSYRDAIAGASAFAGAPRGQACLQQLTELVFYVLPIVDGRVDLASLTEETLRRVLFESVVPQWIAPPERLARLPAGLAEVLDAACLRGDLPADSLLPAFVRALEPEFVRCVVDPHCWAPDKAAVAERVAQGKLTWDDAAGTDEAGPDLLADDDDFDEALADDAAEWEDDPFADGEEDEADEDADDDFEIEGDPVAAAESALIPLRRTEPRIGRNDPCPCGSGKKYKKCCGRG